VDGFLVLLGLALIAGVIGVPLAAFVALSRTGRLQRAIAELELQIQRLRGDAQALQRRLDAVSQQAKPTPGSTAAAFAPPSPAQPDAMPQEVRAGLTDLPTAAQADVASSIPAPAFTPPPPRPAEPKGGVWWPATLPAAAEAEAAPATVAAPAIAESSPAAEPVRPVAAAAAVIEETPAARGSAIAREQRLASAEQAAAEVAGLEERLGGRLFIWIGGIALALAGAFLFKYSIDQGWLGPKVRCSLGAALGIVLLGGGEWMRSREGRIAQSLSAAGVAVLYASLFAAVAFFEPSLIGPTPGFLLLAGLTAGAIALALRQGPFVGLLGLAGGFITPAIVHSDHPNALVLFVYLFAIQLGSQVLLRRRGWWWPSAVAIAGGFLWAALWLGTMPRDWSNDLWVAAFLLATGAATTWAQRRAAVPPSLENWGPTDWQGPITNAIALAIMSALVAAAGYDLQGWLFFGLLAAGQLALARLRAEQEPLAALAAALAAALLVGWSPAMVETIDSGRFIGAGLGMGALFGLGGFGALWRSRQPVRWALLSVLSSAAFFLIAYARLRDVEGLPSWGLVSIALAAVAAALAGAVARARTLGRSYEETLGVYALAASGFIAFAIPLELEHGWIAVGWALLLPAIALIESRLHITWFRYAAWVAAGLALARLLPGPWVVEVPIGTTPIVNWLLYGYGVPLAAFVGAAWLFRRERDDALVTFLEAGAVAIGFLLVTLELHHFFQGGLSYRFDDVGLVEVAGFAVAWLLVALGLARAARLNPRPARLWGMRIVTSLAATVLIVGASVAFNPLLALESVGEWPLLNWLAFAYAMPALLLAATAREIEASTEPQLAIWLQGLAGLFGMLFVSLEIRQLFHGAVLVLGDVGLTEISCLIAAWLMIALGLAYLVRRNGRPVLVGGMRLVTALAVAALVVGPLLVQNPLLAWEAVGDWPLLNLLPLAYGLPALLLAALGYALEESVDRRVAPWLQGLGGAVGLFFIALEIRQLFHGTLLLLGDIGLDELSCTVIAWSLIALGLLRLSHGPRLLAMARAVAALVVAALVVGSLIYANPLLSAQEVGSWPLLNWLIPAYGVPALLMAMISRDLHDPQRTWIALALSSLAVLLGFAFVTLELRQWFQGSRLDADSLSTAENYAYSVGWILYGVALLVAGIVRGGVTLRWASLAVVVLAMAKVFLRDAAVLTDLYRVASFLGLGLSLMGIGYLYQRVVFRRPSAPMAAVSPPPTRS
jgi:uncharacterized membrane protein